MTRWLPLVGALACSPDPGPRPGREPPSNLLVVVLDDVGVDKIGAYGEHPAAPVTPTIEGLAESGVLFRNAWGSPVCAPSRAMLLTGRYPRRYGLGRNVDVHDRWKLPDAEVTLAEALAGAGYTSAALGKWHLAGDAHGDDPGFLTSALDQGFAHQHGTVANLTQQLSGEVDDPDYFRWESLDDGVVSAREGYATTAVVDDAIATIDALPEPWLALVGLHATHAPLHVPPHTLDPGGVEEGAEKVDLVDAMLVAADLELGRLLDGLPPRVRARTTVFVVGDNGTPGFAIAPPWDPHHDKVTVYEGGVRVPFLVSGPLVRARPGSTSEALVSLVDLLPTVAAAAGLPPSERPLDGVSFLPQLADPEAPGRELLYTERLQTLGAPPWPDSRRAVRDARFKLIREGERESLHDLEGGFDDGPDLLDAPLSREAAVALRRLRAELDRIDADVPYEG